MSARDDLLREMTHNHLYMTDERAAELVDAFARELAHSLLDAAPEPRCACGAPQGDDEDDVSARRYWKHSRTGCPLGR